MHLALGLGIIDHPNFKPSNPLNESGRHPNLKVTLTLQYNFGKLINSWYTKYTCNFGYHNNYNIVNDIFIGNILIQPIEEYQDISHSEDDFNHSQINHATDHLNWTFNRGTLQVSAEENVNPPICLGKLRQKHPERLIIGHLNVNSIRYKLDALKSLVIDNIDILVLPETKIGESFPAILNRWI